MVISHIIDFLVDYFTNLNAKKIFGGVLVLFGLALINSILRSGDANKAVLYAIGGIVIGGVGFVVIYFDIAKDKAGSGQDDLSILTKAYEKKEHEENQVSTWHMDEKSDKKSTLENNLQTKRPPK